jgi:serine/threonine-protein kinase
MGEVYEARDTKLERKVAVKVLPSAFVNDPERLSRFQREARMLAALNHPNIATIYGLDQADGTHFLTMELVSGETLAERLKAGPVPIDEALKVAVQIAEALEAAHEKGIIHRDLKPANVKVTTEGKVKVLDFGLAKAFQDDSSTGDPANSPTLSQAATMQGIILGTAAYMSPEQARGKSVDKRTDVWAFGCVLYELLSGRRAFHGEDTTEILATVVKADPDWSRLPAATPAKICDLLRRCLQKDKSQRLRDAGDARLEIQEALSFPGAEPKVAAATPIPSWRRVSVLALAFLLVGGFLAGLAVWHLKPEAPKQVTRLVVNLPLGDQLALDYPAIAISPDGTQLAYVAIRGGIRQIYLRALDSLEARPLPDTEGANTPFFSPDGQWLGFFSGGKLKKISVRGGAAIDLANALYPAGASWAKSGTIIFATNADVQQVPAAGGASQSLTQLRKVVGGWPKFLPDDQGLLFEGDEIAALSLRSGVQRKLIPGGTSPDYSASGHLLYVQRGKLMAVSFDPERLEVTGTAAPVVEGISQIGVQDSGQYSISATGSLVYVPGSVQGTAKRLVWVSRGGTEQALPAPAHAYEWPRLSPDGRAVALGIREGDDQLWLYDLARDTLTRLTLDGNLNQTPTWTPDGKRIAFSSDKEGNPNVFWQPTDGSSGMERLTTGEYNQFPRSFSPDGQLLACVELNSTTGYDIWVLHLADRKTQPFLRTRFNESVPSFSPDGHWLAYVSDESGRFEIYVQPYPGPGGKYQISTEGGTEPVWNPKGKELFYRSGNKMMVVDITIQPGFSVGKPKMLFQGPYVSTPFTMPYYDVSRDGQRFLMLKPSEQTPSLNQIVVVQNWFEELKRRVPTGK